MAVGNALLKEIIADPRKYISTSELTVMRNDPKAKDLDMDLWHKMYQHATTAEYVLGRMLSYFDDKKLVYNEWTNLEPVLSATALNGGLAGALSLISAIHYYKTAEQEGVAHGIFDAKKLGEVVKEFQIESAVLDKLKAMTMAAIPKLGQVEVAFYTSAFQAVTTMASKTITVTPDLASRLRSRDIKEPSVVKPAPTAPAEVKVAPKMALSSRLTARHREVATPVPTPIPAPVEAKPAAQKPVESVPPKTSLSRNSLGRLRTREPVVTDVPAARADTTDLSVGSGPSVIASESAAISVTETYSGGCLHEGHIHDANIKTAQGNLQKVKDNIAAVDVGLGEMEDLYGPGDTGFGSMVDSATHQKIVGIHTKLTAAYKSLNEQKSYFKKITDPSPVEQKLLADTIALQKEISGYIDRIQLLEELPAEIDGP